MDLIPRSRRRRKARRRLERVLVAYFAARWFLRLGWRGIVSR